MFRAIIKQRTNLNMPQVADIQVLSATIKEDLTQKASSTINVVDIPSNASVGDLLGIYDAKGRFIYWGVINSLKEAKIGSNQIQSLYNDNHLITPQTSTNQMAFFNQKPVSNVIELYLKSKETGHQSIANTMNADLTYSFTGLIDKDVKDSFKGLTHTIIDSNNTHMPFPLEKKSENLEKWLYEMFNNYNRIVRPNIKFSNNSIDLVIFYPSGTIEYETDKYWNYNYVNMFDTYNYISNVDITKQDEDTNVVAIYNRDATSLRGAYTILNDGTIQQIINDTAIVNRVGSNKTKFVYDETNNLLDIAKANLPNLQYNHKITFNIDFNGEYNFEDFNLAQPIKFYSSKKNELYDTMLTARNYNIVQNSDTISNAQFTLGKVRTELTSKLNRQ